MACRTVTGRPSRATGTPRLEGDDDLVGLAGLGRVGRVLVDVLDRGVPDVLQEARLDGAPEDVLVDGVRGLLGGGDREVLRLAEGDRLVAGHRVVADRGDALQVGGEGDDAGLEADLVVALAGAAVGDGGGAVLLGGGDEVLDDRRPGQGGDQRVAVHVQGVRLDRRQAVLLGELVLGVGDLGLDGTAREGALADDVQVLAALADVHRDGDDLGARLLGDPADGDGGVQSARVGEYDALGHGFSPHDAFADMHEYAGLRMIRQSRRRDGRPARERHMSASTADHPDVVRADLTVTPAGTPCPAWPTRGTGPARTALRPRGRRLAQ